MRRIALLPMSALTLALMAAPSFAQECASVDGYGACYSVGTYSTPEQPPADISSPARVCVPLNPCIERGTHLASTPGVPSFDAPLPGMTVCHPLERVSFDAIEGPVRVIGSASC
jgi:hypothetical protein